VPANVTPNERRDRIADAALELLAREGARGLTHRAIDRELALPDGSTSYYYSTRAALLLAAAERLLALDTADVEASAGGLEGVAALVEHWLSPGQRTRSMARMELLLTAARDPAFRFMREARVRFIQYAAQGATSPAAQVAATTLVAFADGLLLHGLVGGELTRAELRLALERFRPNESTRRPVRVAKAKPPAKRRKHT
jgi:DNA-binding transcriptional regulator YbjK